MTYLVPPLRTFSRPDLQRDRMILKQSLEAIERSRRLLETAEKTLEISGRRGIGPALRADDAAKLSGDQIVTLAGRSLQARPVNYRDAPADIGDQPRALQHACRDRDARPGDAEHLTEKLVGKRERVAGAWPPHPARPI